MCCVVVCDLETSRMGAPYIYDISHLRVNSTHLSTSVSFTLSLSFSSSHQTSLLFRIILLDLITFSIYSLLWEAENYFNVHGSMHSNNILIHIQQDATLHSLFYLETSLHVSRGTIAHHQERKQLYLQHLVFLIPLLLPAAIVPGSSNGVTNTRCCRCSCLHS